MKKESQKTDQRLGNRRKKRLRIERENWLTETDEMINEASSKLSKTCDMKALIKIKATCTFFGNGRKEEGRSKDKTLPCQFVA